MKPGSAVKTKRSSKAALSNKGAFSRTQLVVFILVFAVIGGYLLYRSFAAGPTTFGISTIGNTNDALSADNKQVSKYTAPQSGKISKITSYISGGGASTGSQNVKAVIYGDSSGTPGALLGTSNEVMVNAGQAYAWVDFTFASPVQISAGTVWMGFIGSNTSRLMLINANALQTNNLVYNGNVGGYAAGPTDPFGSDTQTNGYQYTLYATYAAASSFSKGDLNSDGAVDITDFSILLANYGTNHSAADVNSDGAVNVIDFSILLANYGTTAASAPTVTISASPTSVTSGGSSTLTWSSTNATSCTASGAWSGSKATSGSFSTGSLSSNATYNLSCTGAGGTDSGSATVTVSTSSSSIYWGAYVEGPATYGYIYGGTNWENGPWCDPGYQCARTKFTQNAGKQAPIERWGQGWDTTFDTGIANLIISRGNIPAVDWANDVSYACDRDIANGLWDNDKIIPYAQAMKSLGHPIFLTWDIEMNGTWYHFSPGQQCTDQKSGITRTNTAADFVAMWQHMHDVFDAQGATNVSWTWCPNVDVNHVFTPLSSLYPGDAYVDWTGLEGYNWGSKTGDPWRSFDQVYRGDYQIVTSLAPSKPLFIPEISSEEQGGDKGAWISDMLNTQLPNNYPQIKAFLWFNWRIPNDCGTNQVCDWEIESSPGSQQAFHDGIASPYYKTGGSYGNLPFGKVPVP